VRETRGKGGETFESPYGQALRAFREETGFSQRRLARNSGVHYSEISRLESGERMPTLRTAVELAQALNLTPGERLLLYESATLPSQTPRSETESEGVLRKLRSIHDPIGELPNPTRKRLLSDTAENDRRRQEGIDSADLIVG
jgi:transcriptional regulator with XRE-family HTH domain